MNDAESTSHHAALSHLDEQGAARMVDVSRKRVTVREAVASATVTAPAPVLDAVEGGTLAKGDAIAVARVAAVQAVKQTSSLIPLCHPLPIEWVDVAVSRPFPDKLMIRCSVRTSARTGVEMEALTGAAVAALTIYDMAKAADKGIVIGPVQLESKSGGKSGSYRRSEDAAASEEA